jgi:mannose-1-phosphate guanylyltransferase / phosphomannomutase
MQAIIIAGGKGTRISSITTTLPKAMLSLNNKPLIDYSINRLSKNGCDNIIICCGHLGNGLKDYIDDKEYNIPIRISIENKPLGTAGALHLIKDMLESEFIVLFGDIYTTINIRKMIQFHKEKKADATLALHASDHPHDSTVVEIDKNNRLLKFTEKPGKNWNKYGNLTKTSLYILKKEVINFIPKHKKVDFAKDVFPKKLRKGKKLYGYVTEEYVKDMGTPQRYKEVQAYVTKNFIIP